MLLAGVRAPTFSTKVLNITRVCVCVCVCDCVRAVREKERERETRDERERERIYQMCFASSVNEQWQRSRALARLAHQIMRQIVRPILLQESLSLSLVHDHGHGHDPAHTVS